MHRLLSASWTVARWHGAPVRLHWSALAMVAVAAASGGAWPLALLGAMLGHELAHASAARRLGADPCDVLLFPFLGLCSWRGELSPTRRSLVALAGPAFNLALFAAAQALLWAGGRWLPPAARTAAIEVAGLNAGLAALNVLPLRPLDGAEAWRLPWRWWRGRAEARRATGRGGSAWSARRPDRPRAVRDEDVLH